MNHRERVLVALAHEEPDSVPVDLGSTPDSSIVLPGYLLGAVHNIQPDVPTENILAMFRHARQSVGQGSLRA